jgi:chromosome segregation protein
LEQQEKNHQQRLQRLQSELEQLQGENRDSEIAEIQQQEQSILGLVTTHQGQLNQSAEQVTSIRQNSARMQQEQNELLAELQKVTGRLASLEALQEAALGKQGEDTAQWLERNQLDQAVRLAEKIEVDSGWQQAVEMVLGFHLQAICSDGIDSFAPTLEALGNGAVTLFDTSSSASANSATSDNSLSRKIKSPWDLAPLLSGVKVAEDLSQAMAMRSTLADGESVITKSGIWVGRNWLRLNREAEETSGVLEREQEIRELTDKKGQLHAQSEQLARDLENSREQLQKAEHDRDQIQGELNLVNSELSDKRSTLSGFMARVEQQKSRHTNISREIQELHNLQQQEKEQASHSRTKLHAALEEMESLTAKRENLVKRRDNLRTQHTDIREQAIDLRSKAHAIALRIESMRSSKESLQQNLERVQSQISKLVGRRDELQESIKESLAPQEQSKKELEQQLETRVGIESEMQAARNKLEQVDAALRKNEKERSEAEQKVQQERDILEQGRLQHQEILVRFKTLDEQIDESGFERDELINNLAEDASQEKWEQELEKMDLRIRRLGPINLAAIDEYQEQSERKEYLDSQHDDVSKSLDTLENAIRKIDRETRTRFKETFDKVNTGLQENFPKLFGGGHAYLQLTGDDLLDTGVTVMARPPGKRNSSIHMLSGGEKALTAVALVFSIFSLNPSPFCMLDEVDAPLDDANVGRYCDMVKAMSEKVQVIFITHNKITMEMAHHLTGVTMHEAGVSRLVSVDLNEAAMMAAS